MRLVIGGVVNALVALAVLVAAAWGALAIWYRLPLPPAAAGTVAAVFALVGLVTAVSLFGPARRRRLVAFGVLFAVVAAWYGSIDPPATGDWDPSVARQTTGRIDGDILTLTDMRDFAWRSDSDFDANWTEADFDLTRIVSTDLFLSYWGGPVMAHLVLSFGFDDGRHLAWSVEVRREVDGGFSPVADTFKEHTLSILAVTERDVIGLRSNIRGEDVQLYRLTMTPERARQVIGEYVADANALAAAPAFYNSLTSNCTTVVTRMGRAIGHPVPYDWRVLANGYLPEYLFEHGALGSGVPLDDLRARAHIRDRAQAAGLGDGFSAAIRDGLPVPGR